MGLWLGSIILNFFYSFVGAGHFSVSHSVLSILNPS